jgi:hypothetical protein
MTARQGRGTLLRDAEGAYYVIPDEVLETCRVSEDDAAMLRTRFEGNQDVQGYTFLTTSLTPIATIDITEIGFPQLDAASKDASQIDVSISYPPPH